MEPEISQQSEQRPDASDCSHLCPVCHGVSQHPEVSECRGCFECDHTGTREAYDKWQADMKQTYEEAAEWERKYIARGICSKCGACNDIEAESKCRPTQDFSGEYGCPGDRLWQT